LVCCRFCSLIDLSAESIVFFFDFLDLFEEKFDKNFEGFLSFELFELVIDLLGSFGDHAVLLKCCTFEPFSLAKLINDLSEILFSFLKLTFILEMNSLKLIDMFINKSLNGLLYFLSFLKIFP